MREKMARAMYAGYYGGVWEGLLDHVRDVWLGQADAALAALMEPTDGMIAVVKSDEPPCHFCFVDMIRAARDGK